jgi:hypothetical protein
MTATTPIPENRPLTDAEATLVRWLLEHGNPDAAEFLPQLSKVWVAARCPCGCASIHFAIGGVAPPVGAGMQILSDYISDADDDGLCGVFVFACGGLLAGIEVWSVDGRTASASLPAIEQLRPLAGPSKEEK